MFFLSLLVFIPSSFLHLVFILHRKGRKHLQVRKRASEESLCVCTFWSSDYGSLERARLAVRGNPFSWLYASLRAYCESGTSGLSLHSFLSPPKRRGTASSHRGEGKCLGSTEPHSCTAVILNLWPQQNHREGLLKHQLLGLDWRPQICRF